VWWCLLGLAGVAALLALLLWQSRRREHHWRHVAQRRRQQAGSGGDDSGAPLWLHTVFERFPAPLLVVDRQGHVVAANPQAVQAFGRPRPGEPLIFRLRHHAAVELVEHVLRDGDPAVQAITLEEGTVYHLYAWPWPLTKPPQGAILFLQDVTEHVHAVRARRELAANLGHELRTPLTSLHVLAETLVHGGLEDPDLARRLADRMLNEVRATAALVEDMMALSMIESGRVPLRLEHLPLADVVAERVERLRPLAEEKAIAVVQRVPADIVLPLDRERFGQVLTNLLDNAVKFTPAGGLVTVEAARHGPWVRLVVRDTGPGIPSEALPHIFERFYKLDRARTREGQQGTGLGLAIAKHLVLAHGGRIWAESSPGRGATFFVELPAEPGSTHAGPPP